MLATADTAVASTHHPRCCSTIYHEAIKRNSALWRGLTTFRDLTQAPNGALLEWRDCICLSTLLRPVEEPFES